MSNNQLNFPKAIIPMIFFAIVAIIIFFKSTITIKGGDRGVLYRTLGEGIVTDEPALDEGFHFIAPWNEVDVYNVRQQNMFIKDMEVLSSNGLEIKLDVSVLFQPKIDELGLLHKTRGHDYDQVVIVPEIRSAARSVVGRYTPEQLYSSKRDAIQKEIFDEIKLKTDKQYVQINDVLVRDVTLPPTIKDAIERKLRQEQESLEYEFRLEKARKEAEKQRIEAQGKADANKILSASLTDKILRDKGIEATLELSKSPNTKVVVIGGKDGMPLILGNN
ncbi:MAG TPA: prohibitin family protein [Flavobacteriia bacterium]|jgi:regulator of protease activity HflC (stomatin/prohibitin superfamily)|nr:prohibitin family protein [Flavobacteriia bacterium]